jgi:hypothetical protein
VVVRDGRTKARIRIPVGYPAAEAEVPRLDKKTLDEIATFM